MTKSEAYAEALTAYLRQEGYTRADRDMALLVEKLELALAAIPRPTHYTLRREATGWRIGAGEGVLVPLPRGEVARGLGAIEVAVAFPGDPVGLVAFLNPGKDCGEHTLARKMISVTRKWIGDEIDADMERLLGACTVSIDEYGNPLLTCARLPVPVATSLDR